MNGPPKLERRAPSNPPTPPQAGTEDRQTAATETPRATTGLTFLPGAFVYRGYRQTLSGKPLECLKAFNDAQCKTLTLAALRDNVWSDAVIGEETIRSAVKATRKALRESIAALDIEGPSDPLPVVDRGTGRTAWRLDLP